MNKYLFKALVLALLVVSCKQDLSLAKVEYHRLDINDSLDSKASVERFIAPYKRHVDSSMNMSLSYAVASYSKRDGELNTAIGNMMADAVMKQAGPIFTNRTGKHIDFVLLNHGGIRSIIPQGIVSMRTAYEVMPFENEVVVVGLRGKQIESLINYLQKSKRAHPVSKELELILDANYELVSAKIKGKQIDTNQIYYVATNDYLYNGGDKMLFFQPNEFFSDIDYKIRNVLIDYFKDTDTLDLKRDKRFVRDTEQL
jgi:5'-nucleotidase